MADKKRPLGICDVCGGPIPREQWYTSKRGTPRLHCSVDCRNAGNSRAGAKERGRKAKRRAKLGQWQNPAKLNPPSPEEQARRASLGRKREVERGEWRNPALSDEAREKLSKPRKHEGVLHSAIEKLSAGARVADLTPEEQEAHRAHRRELRNARREESNRWYREQYRRQQAEMTDAEREAQRQKWREANRRRRKDN